MEIVSVSEMRRRDALTIASGVSGIELMGRAAQGIFEAFSGWGEETVILCGSGNNGGDGYALADILNQHGFSAKILTLSDKTTEESAFYKEKVLSSGIIVDSFVPGTDQLSGAKVIVDCLLGTGFQGEVREPYRSAIQEINACKARGSFVISADINSGMNGDTGEGTLITESDLTVTIGLMKAGLVTEAAKKHIGKLVLTDIGII